MVERGVSRKGEALKSGSTERSLMQYNGSSCSELFPGNARLWLGTGFCEILPAGGGGPLIAVEQPSNRARVGSKPFSVYRATELPGKCIHIWLS